MLRLPARPGGIHASIYRPIDCTIGLSLFIPYFGLALLLTIYRTYLLLLPLFGMLNISDDGECKWGEGEREGEREGEKGATAG